MSAPNEKPSPLRSLLGRFDEACEFVILNTPVTNWEGDEAFHDRYLHRRALIDDIGTDREIVVAVVQAMQKEQGRQSRRAISPAR